MESYNSFKIGNEKLWFPAKDIKIRSDEEKTSSQLRHESLQKKIAKVTHIAVTNISKICIKSASKGLVQMTDHTESGRHRNWTEKDRASFPGIWPVSQFYRIFKRHLFL